MQCNQEDRHRKTLTPRGHVEKLERQILQCQALLRRHYPGFTVDDLDNILAREGIEIEQSSEEVAEAFQFANGNGGSRPYPRQDMPPPMPPKGYPYPPPPHMIHPGYPMGVPPPGYHPPPHGAPYPHMIPPPGMYDPRIHPAFQPQHHIPSPHMRSDADIKGQDPQSNDMSNAQVWLLFRSLDPKILTSIYCRR